MTAGSATGASAPRVSKSPPWIQSRIGHLLGLRAAGTRRAYSRWRAASSSPIMLQNAKFKSPSSDDESSSLQPTVEQNKPWSDWDAFGSLGWAMVKRRELKAASSSSEPCSGRGIGRPTTSLGGRAIVCFGAASP